MAPGKLLAEANELLAEANETKHLDLPVHTTSKPLLNSSTSAHTLSSALEAAHTRFAARNPRSRALHEEAAKTLPGGNTRSVLYTSPYPIFMKRGQGSRLEDEDGHEYVYVTHSLQ